MPLLDVIIDPISTRCPGFIEYSRNLFDSGYKGEREGKMN
jgi:hypothetical protein